MESDAQADGGDHDGPSAAAGAGLSDAEFEERYREVAPALYTWAELRIRPEMRGQVDPQDVIQEVWLRAIRKRADFDARTMHFRAWVLTIAKNVLLESFRKLRRTPRLEAEMGGTTRMFALDGCPESITSFTQRLAKDEAVRRFLELAGTLDAVDRQILVRCGLEDRTCADVGRELEMGEQAVIKRWQRLRARLRAEAWVSAILGV